MAAPVIPISSNLSKESVGSHVLRVILFGAIPAIIPEVPAKHIEIGTADAEAIADLGISDGVGAHTEDGICMGVEISASDIREDEEEFEAETSARGTMEIAVDSLVTGGIYESIRGDVPDPEGTLYDIVHYMSEVPLDRITEFETAQRQLEAGQLMASRKSAGLTNGIRRDRDDARKRLRRLVDMTITRSEMTPEAIKELIAQRVAEALANYEVTRAANALEAESQSQNGNDIDNVNGGNGNGNHEDGGNNGNGNPNENGRGLTKWFKKMEIVFHINDCPEVYQVKYATCTLVDSALTWWNLHKRIVGVDVVFAMTWKDLMKLMTKVYCPRNEIQKMETELWNLTVKNNDVAAYTHDFKS
ncbi:putative reverse transcriptase domain-containing protein [Tanacetum coccineum]